MALRGRGEKSKKPRQGTERSICGKEVAFMKKPQSQLNQYTDSDEAAYWVQPLKKSPGEEVSGRGSLFIYRKNFPGVPTTIRPPGVSAGYPHPRVKPGPHRLPRWAVLVRPMACCAGWPAAVAGWAEGCASCRRTGLGAEPDRAVGGGASGIIFRSAGPCCAARCCLEITGK